MTLLKQMKKLIYFKPKTSRQRYSDKGVKRGKYLISNIVGTSHDAGSKKDYWERRSGSRFTVCQVEKCSGRATVGGHVWIRGGLSPWYLMLLPRRSSSIKTQDMNQWFILPLCHKCNKDPALTHPHSKLSKKSAIFIPRPVKRKKQASIIVVLLIFSLQIVICLKLLELPRPN